MKRILSLLIVFSFLLSVVPSVLAEGNDVLHSTSFENGIDSWKYRSETSKVSTKFTTSCSTDGSSSIMILDDSADYATGVDSPYIAITAGETYTALINTYLVSGSVSLFLKFLDANKKQITSASKSGTVGMWKDISITATAPSNAVYCIINLSSLVGNQGRAYFDNFRLVKGTVSPSETVQGTIPPSDEDPYLKPYNDGVADGTEIYNDSFESGMGSWSYFASGILEFLNVKSYTSDAYNGSSCILIEDTSTSVAHGLYSTKINATQGNIYTASAYMKTLSGSSAALYMKFYDKDDNILKDISNGKNASEWHPVYISSMAPENTSYIVIQVVISSNHTGKCLVDYVRVHKGIVRPEFLENDFTAPSQVASQDAQIIAPVNDKLQYKAYNDMGDKLGDYSIAGFHAGKYQLPVTENLQVVETLEPSGGANDNKLIQAAIDRAERTDGGMNVVKLKAGKYNIGYGGINIKSGVVLSGEGQGPEGTLLYAYLPYQNKPVSISGSAITEVGNKAYITDTYVKAGSKKINVSASDAANFSIGDKILINHANTMEWSEAMEMVGVINVYDDDATWTEGTINVKVEREITDINGTEITLNYALFIPYLTEYNPTYITKYDDSGRVENAGIENLRIESYFNGDANDEMHATTAITVMYAKNIFVRDITSKYFYMGLFAANTEAKQVTVQNCSCLEPVSQVIGSRRYPFIAYATSQQILGSGLYAYDGRHDFATSSTTAGAIVYLDSVGEASSTSTETHSMFATGVLYDNIYHIGNSTDGFIALANRGIYGTSMSQGWTSASCVAWNCLSPAIIVHKPPLTYQNFSVGTWGVYKDSAATNKKATHIVSYQNIYRTGKSTEYTAENFKTDENTSMIGDAYKESPYTPVNPRSIYKAQLSERITGVISNARPNSPIITYPACDNVMESNSIKVAGLATLGASKVLVYIDNKPYEATISSDNTFSVDVTLNDGNHKIYATQVIDGVEGNKTADRFITINESDGNPDYLQSIYSPEQTTLLVNDTRKTYDYVSDMTVVPETMNPAVVFGGYADSKNPITVVNHLGENQDITGHYRAVAGRVEEIAGFTVKEFGMSISIDDVTFPVNAPSQLEFNSSGGYGILFFNLMPNTKYYVRPYVIYTYRDGTDFTVNGYTKEFTTTK